MQAFRSRGADVAFGAKGLVNGGFCLVSAFAVCERFNNPNTSTAVNTKPTLSVYFIRIKRKQYGDKRNIKDLCKGTSVL